MPFFSIIIPLFNKQDYISKTLHTVLSQTFQDFEIILVDDGSTDKSVQLVHEIEDSRISIRSQKNQGVSVARNNGIALATGNYIALLDADDLWLPNHLESLHELIEKFPEAGLYCTRYAIKYSEHYTKDIIFSQPVSEGMSIIEDYFASSMINPIAWTSAVAFAKTNFEELGGFDIQLNTGQDIDLWIRFALQHNVYFNNTITMIYNKDTKNNLSASLYNDQRNYYINKYVALEEKNKSLNKYLDLNRFALAIRSKIAGHLDIYKKQTQDINPKNLNLKQHILIKLPRFVLRLLAKMHQRLIQNKIYVKPLR